MTRRHFNLLPGQDCLDCLAIDIEIENIEGNSLEYVVQDDFTLWTNQPSLGGQEGPAPVVCDAHPTTSFHLSPDQGGTVIPKAIARGSGPIKLTLCFKNIEDTSETIRRQYLLAYSHEFFYVDDATPTPTPTKEPSVQRRQPPVEAEQRFRYDWTIFFSLNIG